MPLATHYVEIGRMDELARRDSSIHRLDARALILATAVFLGVVMSFPRYELSALTPLLFFPVALIARAGLPAGFLLRKVALAAPFAVIVGIFNPWLDRTPVAHFGSVTLSGGWISFLSILLRAFLTVLAALVLVSCTGIYRLCAGLERLGMPRVLAVQILFLHRYFFVIGDEGARMLRGVAARSAGADALPWRLYAPLAGHLLLRAMSRSQRIHHAMLARGFDGEARVLRPSSFGWRELLFVAGWSAFFLAARRWNLPQFLVSPLP
jgi:cobalt/nickel transport system permease protein